MFVLVRISAGRLPCGYENYDFSSQNVFRTLCELS